MRANHLSRRAIQAFLACLLVGSIITSGSAASSMQARQASPTPTIASEMTPAAEGPCPGGRLRLADLSEVDRVWSIAVEADSGIAQKWRGDSILVSADVTCEFLAQAIRVRTVFYSADARSFYEPETGRERPLDPGEPDLLELPVQSVSFEALAEALENEGLQPHDSVSAAGISIRYNTVEEPFGPDTIPLDTVVFHVTIGGTLDARDIYVDAATGDVYRFGE